MSKLKNSSLKRLGILVDRRDYYLPYIEWLFSKDGSLFDIVGVLDKEDIFSGGVNNYSSKRVSYSLEELAESCDIVLSLGYWKLISKEIIDTVPMGILNLHHSYLLRYRGRHMFTWAIINEEIVHGTTLHYMSALLDDGPILDSRKVKILENDTAGSLSLRLNNVGLKMIKEGLPKALNMDTHTLSMLQKPDINYKMYREKDLSNEISVDLLEDSPTFFRYIRALTFPGAPKPYVLLNDKKVFLTLEE